MKDYERYMNRQRMSDTGMARLMKLETERPAKGGHTGRRRQALPRWAKGLSAAAAVVLVVGLCALPFLRRGALWARPQPVEEELIFHEVDNVSFTTYRPIGWGMERAMDEQDAAAIFGCAPDDFIGLLEQVGLDQFDMQYYTVDMSDEGDYSYRFWMKGDYISPRVEEEMPPTVSCIPANDVWLEIYEGHSYLDEPDWAALEPQTFHGHQVTATWNGSYEASAAFDVESGGKTYGVLYKACTYGDCDAKALVTKMMAFLATEGITVPESLVPEQDAAGKERIKSTGLYVMEAEKEQLAPCIAFDGESYTFTQSLLSSHSCHGDYTVENGRVTVRCDSHHFVFDILDGNTLRFVAAESSTPVHYKTDLSPEVTDGALFRWREEVTDADVELSGNYFMKGGDGSWDSAVKVVFDEGTVTISSDRLNYHTCVCSNTTRERVNGKELVRMVCDKCGGIYSFEIVDKDTLQFDTDHSAIHDHHNDWTFEVTDGTVFAHVLYGTDDAPTHILKIGELDSDMTYYDETHHPEPTHHVETHHSDHH